MARTRNKQTDSDTLQSLSPAPQAGERIISASSGIDGSLWQLELQSAVAIRAHAVQLEKLAASTKNPNPFFAPAFLEPTMEHLARTDIQLLTLRKVTGQHRELKLFAPAIVEKTGLRRHTVLRIWSHPFAPLSTPLIPSDDAGRTVSEFINCIEAAPARDFSAVLFEDLPRHCFFSKAMHASPVLSDRLIRHAGKSRAAILGGEGLQNATRLSSGKRKQRMNKAHERLAKLGDVEFRTATNQTDVLSALESHLALENQCWKGKKGTSILSNPSAAAFVNSAVANMISKGECTLHALHLAGKPIASMIMIHKDGHYFPWKIAFDEAYAKFSIGNLLTVHVNNLIAEDKGFHQLDSLASDLNQTARRFWPDELQLSSMVIGLGKSASKTALQISSELDFLAENKRRLKKLLGRSL